MLHRAGLETPWGWLQVSVDDFLRLKELRFCKSLPEDMGEAGKCQAVLKELDAYIKGDLKDFEVPLAPEGTEFQQQVWDIVSAIPFGNTRTYGDIAAEIGSKNLSRAVGAANGANPIALIIPCHRVIAKSGALQGYAYGLDLKSQLLKHEQEHSGQQALVF